MHRQLGETLSVFQVMVIVDYVEFPMLYAQHISRKISGALVSFHDTYVFDRNIRTAHETNFPHNLIDVRPDLGILS